MHAKPRINVDKARLLGIRHAGASRIKTGVKAGFPDGPPCFLRGTSVLTARGATRVEDLAVGDSVVTAKGSSLPIKWIGSQLCKKEAGVSGENSSIPVRIARYAIDGLIPHADLYLSPAHALFMDGVLIPAIYLVNGSSIVQATPTDVKELEYFHIELATHEIIFAEGVPAETLLVVSDREAFASLINEPFDSFIERRRLSGTANGTSMTPCASRICFNGRRSELKALLRRVTSQVIDIRDPIQVARDRIATRARDHQRRENQAAPII